MKHITYQRTKRRLVQRTLTTPTKDLDNCKSEFTNAGFQILSEHTFVTKSVQKDISGDNTLIIYSTPVPLKDAIDKLKPIIDSLPYK